MTPEQIIQLLRLLERIADRQFTITQATDWPMVYVLVTILVVAMGLFQRDIGKRFEGIRDLIKEFKINDEKSHDTIRAEFEKADEAIRESMKDCQSFCCPERRGRRDMD